MGNRQKDQVFDTVFKTRFEALKNYKSTLLKRMATKYHRSL